MDKIDIYNPTQAYYYIQEGLIPLAVKTHSKTGNIFFVFDKAKSNPLYTNWLNRTAKIKRI